MRFIFSRPVENIRGFTREVIIEITASIESQELRRCQSNEIGVLDILNTHVPDQQRTLSEKLQTSCGYKHNETTFTYELDVSFAPTYAFV